MGVKNQNKSNSRVENFEKITFLFENLQFVI